MISVICPVLNEEKYIKKLLEYFDIVLPKHKELILVDGGSTDKTIEIIRDWIMNHDNVSLYDNRKKYVPYALNIAIKKANGDHIIRIDAHCEYSEDYFAKIIETFKATSADVVGGPTRIKSTTMFQEAVEIVLTSRFGVGNNKIHNYNYSGYVDHVTFGAWKRSIFNEIGYFDERLIRNQDDEFHYRAKSFGMKIYLNSEIKLYYSPRSDYKELIKQYFQYGYFKPLVLIKVKSEAKIRHFIPSLLTVYLLSLFIFHDNIIFYIPILSYLFLVIINVFNSQKKLKIKLLALTIFPTVHISYGLGFIFGFFKVGIDNIRLN